MAKAVATIKKAAKKVVAKKKACETCTGTGLLDPHNLCVMCDGSGKVS